MNDFILPAQKKLESLEHTMNSAAEALRRYEGSVAIVHHNDTDGISAGAIISEAVKRIGKEVNHYCMEQIYPMPLAHIYENNSGPVIIVDLGISKKHEEIIHNKTEDRPTILIDHHESDSEETLPVGYFNFFDINCTKYGIDGDCLASASTIAYLFASKLCDIPDLAHLAVLGAAGDKNNTEKGRFPSEGLDRLVEEKAQNVRFEEDVYQIRLADDRPFQVMDEIIRATTLLGSVGYRKKFEVSETGNPLYGPYVGLKILMDGYNDKTRSIVEGLEAVKEEAYNKFGEYLKQGNYKKLDNIIFFDTSDFFKGMGVKTVGTFCEYLISPSSRQEFSFIHSGKYLLGAQLIEPFALGDIEVDAFSVPDALKISIRTPKELQAKIEANQSLAVSTLLKMANPGQIGSSHKLRGSTIITKTKLAQLLENCNKVINTGEPHPLNLPELDLCTKC